MLSIFASPPKRSKALARDAGMTFAGNTRVLAFLCCSKSIFPFGRDKHRRYHVAELSQVCCFNSGSIHFKINTSYLHQFAGYSANNACHGVRSDATEVSGIGRQE